MDVVIGLGGITVLPGGNVDRDGASFRRRMFVLYLDTQHAGGGAGSTSTRTGEEF